MSNVQIPPWVPPEGTIPGETAGRQPLLGAIGQMLAAQVNGSVGWRALQWGTRHHQVGNLRLDAPKDDVDDSLTWVYSDPEPITLQTSPAGRFLYLAIWGTALDGLVKEPGGDVDAYLQVQMKSGGVNVGSAVRWGVDNGWLRTAPQTYPDVRELVIQQLIDGGATRPVAILAMEAGGGDWVEAWADAYANGASPPDVLMTTGWETEALAADDPRPLALPADPAEIELVFTSVGVRVYSVTFIEIYFPQIS